MTAKDLTLRQVFCCDVLFFFPHQLCESGFPFCWFFFRSMLPRKDRMAEVATLLADGPLLEAFHIQHMSASSKASSVFVLLLSASPSIFFRIDYQIIVISEMHHGGVISNRFL